MSEEQKTSTTSAQSACNGLLCEHVGCSSPATHYHEPWIFKHKDIQCCEKHSRFYKDLGMRVWLINT